MPKYRLNPININSITEFGRVRGNRAGEIRNTYMVKFTGANANTNKEINELRKYLKSEMKQGRIYYKYLDSPDIKSDCMEQKRAYEAFISTCHFDTALVNAKTPAKVQEEYFGYNRKEYNGKALILA